MSGPIALSFLVHLGLILAFTVRALLFPNVEINAERAARVDIIALPDKLPDGAPPPAPEAPKPTQEKSPPTPAPSVAKPAAPLPAPNPDAVAKREQRQRDALRRLQDMRSRDAVDRMRKNEELRQRLAAQQQQFKGNVISKGSELSGLARLEHDDYSTQVGVKVRSFFSLPEYLINQKLQARVRVRIQENGQLISAELVRSSGNPRFDEAALQAVQGALPLPAPPERLRGVVRVEGIVLGFPE